MTTAGVLWAVMLLIAVAAASGFTVRAVATGRSPLLALLAVWAALAVAGHFASGRPGVVKSVLIAATLALPIVVAGVSALGQIRAGRNHWRALGVAIVLGAAVAAVTPLLQLWLLCRVAGDCL